MTDAVPDPELFADLERGEPEVEGARSCPFCEAALGGDGTCDECGMFWSYDGETDTWEVADD